jgi:nitrous oxidase accessory protein NosD
MEGRFDNTRGLHLMHTAVSPKSKNLVTRKAYHYQLSYKHNGQRNEGESWDVRKRGIGNAIARCMGLIHEISFHNAGESEHIFVIIYNKKYEYTLCMICI